MARIINATAADGRLFGFSIKDGRFHTVATQAGLIAAAGAPPLAALARTAAVGTAPSVGRGLDPQPALSDDATIDAAGALIVPAGVDVHVHSRDPGLTHKEDWQSLAAGAWRGGVTAVADMPNTTPMTMTREAVVAKAKIARASGLDFRLQLGVGASNIQAVGGLLSDLDLPLCALKVFYGRTTGELMYDDLETLGRLLPADGRRMIVFHSEDQCTVDCNHARLEPRTHATDNAAFAVHSEIRTSEAAHRSTQTILDWARTSYKRPVHIAHVSTPLEVEMVAAARAQGASVTCEVAPHHLLFSTDDYAELGPLVKMNPPLRSRAEVDALLRLVGEGAVEVYATDHAPHLLAEKRTEVAKSPSGVPSLELYYPLLWEVARRSGLDLGRAVAMAATTPAALFGFTDLGQIADGYRADFVWLDETPQVVRNRDVVSKCGWTPYDGWTLPVTVAATWTHGRCVYTRPG